MSIAITGATGQLGRLVIAALKKRIPASRIIALARTPGKAGDLAVTVRQADYGSAPAEYAAALAGVETLLLISSSEVGQRESQHRHVIEAARQAGVKQIVYTSLLRAPTSPMSLAPEHRATEAMLRDSGLKFTLLRNGWYAENYTAGFPAAVAHGALVGSASEGRLSLATRADYAEAAAVVLAQPEAHIGHVYELAGDTAPTLAELAAELSRQVGKTIPYKNLPAAEYSAVLRAAGLPEVWAQGLPAFDLDAAAGALFDDGHQLSRLIGRPTTTPSDYVAAALQPQR
jgi:NAD(P)H dehydrogenase (quinone)